MPLTGAVTFVSEMVPSLTPATPPTMLLAPELATSVFCADEFGDRAALKQHADQSADDAVVAGIHRAGSGDFGETAAGHALSSLPPMAAKPPATLNAPTVTLPKACEFVIAALLL